MDILIGLGAIAIAAALFGGFAWFLGRIFWEGAKHEAGLEHPNATNGHALTRLVGSGAVIIVFGVSVWWAYRVGAERANDAVGMLAATCVAFAFIGAAVAVDKFATKPIKREPGV